ncbi:MAG: hypothetical protein KDD92_11165 [Caldilineaceae bacterium]|nr:hypothetical protein [Caldilineaceae bacterium]
MSPRKERRLFRVIPPDQALGAIPDQLRTPLLEEYSNLMLNFLEQRWSPTELSGGRFCEIVYTILDGYSSGTYASSPSKPRNFVTACQQLEQRTSLPRSLRILIPRLLPGLYEIRNNRGVGHVGGDVDPNRMDSTAVVSIVCWIMAELVRVFHNLSTREAQIVADSLAEIKVPLVWRKDELKRILDPKISQKDQILILLSTEVSSVKLETLFSWLDGKNKGYFKKNLRELHSKRLIEYSETEDEVLILPPGSNYVSEYLNNWSR